MPRFIANLKQSLFILSEARYAGYIGGIGSGKTAAGAVKTLTKIDRGEPGIVVAPDFPHFTKSTWPEWKKWIPWERVRNKHLKHPFTKDKRLIFETSHGLVDVYYGGIDDPESWTGPTVNWAWFDESRRKDERNAFDVLAGRCRTGVNPQLFTTTSPRGQLHWLHDVFVAQAFDLTDELRELFTTLGVPLCEYFQARTDENSHNLDPLYWASLKALYTGKLEQQELGGEFVIFEGAVFENFSEANITRLAEYIPGVPVEWAVDDGFTAEHPRVFWLTQEIPPFINVFAEYVITYELAEKSIEHILALPYTKADVAYIDSSAAELAARLWDEGIDTISATHSVEEGIKHTRAFICDAKGVRRLRLHPRCAFSAKEIPSYTYPRRQRAKQGSGQPKPIKKNDNAADTMRYLLWFKSIQELDELAADAALMNATYGGVPTHA